MGQIILDGGPSSQTSNSQFLFVGSTLWLVTNSDINGNAYVLKSVDFGVTFAEIGILLGIGLGFDPAICLDTTNNIHIVGSKLDPISLATSLIEYRFSIATTLITGPFTLTENSLVGGDYDVSPLANGNSLVVVSLLNANNYPGESVVALVVSPTGAIISSVILDQSSFRSGNTYGQISIVTTDNQNFELYVGSHPKQITFKDFPVVISLFTWNSIIWSTATSLLTSSARFVSNKMTVIAQGASRYLAHCLYTQDRTGLIGNILLGYAADSETPWTWATIAGTSTSSYSEPTLSVAPEGISLAWIQRDFTVSQSAGPVLMSSLDVSTWGLTPLPNFRYQVSATYLRGTTQILPALNFYGIVAETLPGGNTFYYGGFDTAPVAHVVPKTVNLTRDTLVVLSGSESSSNTLDPLTFAWATSDPTLILTPSGENCSILLPSSAGPSARTITVTLTVTAENFPPAIDTCVVSVAEIAPPVIVPPASAIQATRNSVVTITPVINYSGGYPLTYTWTQISGTVFTPVSSTTPALTFNDSGANINGEQLIWQLSVSDSINNPVTQDYAVNVASYVYNPLTQFLSRVARQASISNRNTVVSWNALIGSKLGTNLQKERSFTMRDGTPRSLYLNDHSVLVYSSFVDELGTHLALRQLLPQNPNDTVLDAVITETDETWMLTSSGLINRYLPSITDINVDLPTTIYSIPTLVSVTNFTSLTVGYSYANVRVLAVSGINGAFLMQLNSTTGVITGSLLLDDETGFTYGADNILWIRTYDVENLNKGLVFLGTQDALGNTYETLINLANRQIIGTWDASKLINTLVTTGEFLFDSLDTYSGIPQPPSLGFPISDNKGVILNWIQQRPDLTTGYQVWMSTTGTNYSLQQTINLGSVSSAFVPNLAPGKTYYFYMITLSLDGDSGISNIENITL